ncbi:MAG: ABC transporter ATP-binding protein [Candidatus Omnitrophica bacterium]|nr:ABC transporter ATP-binding protein [Candidatus Omnitrophota bacterium]
MFDGVSFGMIIPVVDIVFAGRQIVLPHEERIPAFVVEWVSYINNLAPQQVLNYFVIVLIVLFVLKHLGVFFQSYLMVDLGLRVVRDMRRVVYDRMIELSLDHFVKTQVGELVSRITYDTSVVKNATTESLRDLFYQPIQLVVYTIVLLGIRSYFAIPWSLVFVSVVLMPGIIYPVVQIGKRLKKLSARTQEQMATINASLFETFSGIKIVKAFSSEEGEKKKFNWHNQNFYRVLLKSGKRMLLISPITEISGVICLAAVLWMGGREVVHNNLSPGAFLAFLAALLSLVKPFNRLSRVYGVNQQALAAAERIFEILDSRPSVSEASDPIELGTIQDSVAFANVGFKYEDKTILQDVNLTVHVGEILAIVGKSGSGKTTLVNLIPRFYDPTEGEVLVDGIDIKQVSFRSLRSQIGVVTQETILFYDTVRNNIAYGRPDASLDEVIRAAQAANAHMFIEQLPEKYNTLIGERGFRLSGGERQRLAIARALLQDPPILILDEATSQLDAESERLVQEAIDRLIKGRTVFVIAHRLSTVKHATHIVVLDGGTIVGRGTHEQLLGTDTLYKSLYNMQFETDT